MKEDSLITYETLAKIAYNRVKEEIENDPEFDRIVFCKENGLSYSTFAKFMAFEASNKGRKKSGQRVWVRFLPDLLKVLGIKVKLNHSIHYYSIKSGGDKI